MIQASIPSNHSPSKSPSPQTTSARTGTVDGSPNKPTPLVEETAGRSANEAQPITVAPDLSSMMAAEGFSADGIQALKCGIVFARGAWEVFHEAKAAAEDAGVVLSSPDINREAVIRYLLCGELEAIEEPRTGYVAAVLGSGGCTQRCIQQIDADLPEVERGTWFVAILPHLRHLLRAALEEFRHVSELVSEWQSFQELREEIAGKVVA